LFSVFSVASAETKKEIIKVQLSLNMIFGVCGVWVVLKRNVPYLTNILLVKTTGLTNSSAVLTKEFTANSKNVANLKS
jgi:hypothetical protein